MTNMRRALGALAAGAIALPFLASPAVASDTQIPTPRDITSFCANATAPQFTDVPSTTDAELALAIRCLRTAGITTGQTANGVPTNTYGLVANVTRLQMAAFIARLIDAASARETAEGSIRELPAVPANSPFVDVPRDGTNLTNSVLRLHAAGIVAGNPEGIGANRYGPQLNVTRGQMASFINRAVAYMTGGNAAQAGTSGNGFSNPSAHYYSDVPQANHEANVKGITSAGIANGTTVNGVPTKRYDYLADITRQQMARFLARTLATLFVDAGGKRILGVNNAFSANFPDGDRVTATRVSSATPLTGTTATAANSRTYTATGLAAGVEYRITLVRAGQISVATDGSNAVRFAVGADAGNGSQFNLVNTGAPQAIFTSVNGATPMNNQAAGTATTTATSSATAVAFATGANGTITFTIIGAQGQDVIPVIYINGGGNQSSYAGGGGLDFRLEVDDNGRAVEFFGLAGETEFRP